MKSRKDTPYLDLFQIIGLKLKKKADEIGRASCRERV